MQVKLKILSSLAKVFADEEPTEYPETGRPSGFKNETISFQAAYRADTAGSEPARIEVESPIAERIRVRQVRLVPVGLAAFTDADDNYLRKTPGLYPDLLTDLKDGVVRLLGGQWSSLWIDVEPDEEAAAGVYPVKIAIRTPQGEPLAERTVSVEILDALLPPQTLRNTNWFYTDCLAQYYQVPVFSERHWKIIENFAALAARRGINMILTPAFTPPLDTAVGGERLTTQLVDVRLDQGAYSFGFEKLKRWVGMCGRAGIRYFEFSHLFTQWGARSAPKVMATVDGVYKKLFGWETAATDEEYKRFLREYLGALTPLLREWGIADRCYFHISDEPSLEHLRDYKAAREIAAPYLQGFEIIDALSDFEFYKSGAISKPIPANDHIAPFIEAGVKGLWTYYCVGQYKDVSNLFIAMPSARNRIFGVQLYKYGIEGILQWGYDFYNTQYSLDRIDPYAVTDAGGWVPSGDAFQVYPGRGGQPEESIRLMVKAQALYDLRAFRLLESLTDKAFVLRLIEDGLSEPVTFSRYPKSDVYLLRLRNRVNREIMARI